ncbi:tripartite tricarboxylate transporter substrate binding protein [Neptunicoccus cionae]|uniref:tripartite tricarboxylate transporter substrate binding protein n=1 Tax=Neptunicoccus cionae TaxID=2035344 RepID=UPI000C761281|nr:tripartite tricarboxylate transporter substrate binding protein [Amylibacter cionae]PLS21049.1 hypothetical protein C0U40_12900 [Amylibacter cionae]
MIKKLLAAAGIAALSLGATSATAQDWTPKQPITLQIGFGAGGGTDTLGRAIAASIEESNGWNIIVENVPGGGGVAMFSRLVNAKPDGYTLAMGVNTPVLMGLATRGDSLPFKIDSFDYMATVVTGPGAIVAPGNAPYNTVPEMAAYSKENDGVVFGYDASTQLMLINALNKADDAGFVAVPHNSGAELVQGLLGGNLGAAYMGGAHIQYLESGDLKMLAVATEHRQPYSQDTTSLIEQGYPISVAPVFYIAAPAGLPEDVHAAIAKMLDDAINSPAVTKLVSNMMHVPPRNEGPEGTKHLMFDGLPSILALIEAGK